MIVAIHLLMYSMLDLPAKSVRLANINYLAYTQFPKSTYYNYKMWGYLQINSMH